jgi:hypothetical protein
MGTGGGGVVYEVNLELDAAIESAYRAWLQDHVRELLALPGFVAAQAYEVADPPPSADRLSLCVQYRLRDRAALDAYLREHAPRMRADGVARFGNGFTATRRILRPVD